MTQITAQMIKDLRERTGVGMSKCKSALEEAMVTLSWRFQISARLEWQVPLKKKAFDK